MSNSLQPRGLQHTRLPCLSLSPEVCSKSCPFSQWCFPTISCSVAPFSSCTQSFLASWSFPMSRLFASGGQCIELLRMIKKKKTDVGTEILLNLPSLQQSSSISLSGTFSRSRWCQFRHCFQRYLILFLLISFYRCPYLLHGELATVRL